MSSFLNIPIQKLASLLQEFRLSQTVAFCAGLLTVPEFQANTPRLEFLAHLAAMNCGGKRKATTEDLRRWLNRNLESSEAERAEDPPEDVFISNIGTSTGNYRIFQGNFPNNDHYLQLALNPVERMANSVSSMEAALLSAISLLRLSDLVCERLKLTRWTLKKSVERAAVLVCKNTNVDMRAAAVSFNIFELAALGVTPESLAPYILNDERRTQLIDSCDTNGGILRRHPLMRFGDELVLVLPNSVCAAIRHHLFSVLVRHGMANFFDSITASDQAAKIFNAMLRSEMDVVPHTRIDAALPLLHSFEVRYEPGHFIHLLVLPDSIDSFVNNGEDSVAHLSPSKQQALKKFIIETATALRARTDFRNGTTILSFAGLGRLQEIKLQIPDFEWEIIDIDLPDMNLLLNADFVEFRRFMKSRAQISWAKSKGISFLNPNGAFGHFCYWVERDFKVVPRDLALKPNCNVLESANIRASNVPF